MAGGDPAGAVRIVVVDDEPDIRSLVRHVLSRQGCWGTVVGEAADGDEAVELVERLQPDVCLLDLKMPTPGDRALPLILKVAPSCMVAVFSAWGSAYDHRRLLDLGAFCCYSKSDLVQIAGMLEADYTRFRAALEGDHTTPSWMQRPPS